MKSRRFYTWVWRINGLLILAAALVGLGMLLIVAAMLVSDLGRARHSDMSVKAVQGPAGTPAVSLEDFRDLKGTHFLRASLTVKEERSLVYSKGSRPLRNFYYVDTTTHATHWLIPEYTGLIVDHTSLPAEHARNVEETGPQTVVYELADADTDGDGALTRSDALAIAISDPAGRGFVRLLEKVERLNAAHLASKRTLLLIYTKEGAMFSAEVDLDSGKIARQTPLKM